MHNLVDKIISKLHEQQEKRSINTIAITGPTGSGKSDLALWLGKKLKKNIVNMDSRQFFMKYPIITCSPTEDHKKHPHYLYNFLQDEQYFSMGNWVEKIQLIDNKILVGGSMFYLHSLQQGIPLVDISEQTKNIVNNCDCPYALLTSILPNHNLHKNNHYRVLRLLEFYLETGYTFNNYPHKYKEEMFTIWCDRSNLLENITLRASDFFNRAIEELKQFPYNKNVSSIIGYNEIHKYINGEISYDQALNDLIVNTCKYAKYQRKWKKKLAIDYDAQIS